MPRYFNVAGPCVPGEHYMLPAQERCGDLMPLIEQKQYVVLHAARQTGKTTLLKEVARQINAEGRYHALYCSLETLRMITDAREGVPRILDELRSAIDDHPALGAHVFGQCGDPAQYTVALRKALSGFCRELAKPLVIFFDEVDCLSNGTLIAFLQQLRYGYVNRPDIPFVHSVALVGMRNIRDYKARIRDGRDTLGSASPFNIVTETLTLRNFTSDDIARLYAQHADDTGQDFPPSVVERVYAHTRGQPWLVNAIAREIVAKILAADAARPIVPEYVDQAVEAIITRRDTHIDSLMERLSDARVQKIVEPVITGKIQRYDLLDDDYRYVLDLGLLREAANGIAPGNRVYGDIIIRKLSFQAQQEIEDAQPEATLPRYLTADGLDMSRLLADFQQFWRENSDIWVEKYQYKEAAPHLILQAFVQRVANGGGRITREMAGGRKRLDLCLEYAGQRYPIELKIRYDDATYAEGQDQLAGYMDALGCAEGWLLVFDRRDGVSWADKIFWRTTHHAAKIIHIVGC